MRKKIALLMIFLLAMCPVQSIQAAKQPEIKLELVAADTKLMVGKTLQLTVSCGDPSVSLEGIVYEVDKTNVAIVDATGLLTAVGIGRVKVTAKTADGAHKASLAIRVDAAPQSVKITARKTSVNVGKTIQVTAAVLPKAVKDKAVTWSSSDEAIATVTDKGKIQGFAPGKVTITASNVAVPEVQSSVEIEVIRTASAVSVSAESPSVLVGDTLALSCQIEPTDVSSHEVTYKSNRPKIAIVDAEGVVTGVKAGVATITATAKDGSRKFGTTKIEVVQRVEGVTMAKKKLNLGLGNSHIVAELIPRDSTNKHMSWVSSNPEVVSVEGTTNRAKVTVHAWGNATITGTTEDGGFSTSAHITGGLMRLAVHLRKARMDDADRLHLTLYNESNLYIDGVTIALMGYDANQQAVVMSHEDVPVPKQDFVHINIPSSSYGQDSTVCYGMVEAEINPNETVNVRRVNLMNPAPFDNAVTMWVAIIAYTYDNEHTYEINQNLWKWVEVEMGN